jgi:hypothetical protein
MTRPRSTSPPGGRQQQQQQQQRHTGRSGRSSLPQAGADSTWEGSLSAEHRRASTGAQNGGGSGGNGGNGGSSRKATGEGSVLDGLFKLGRELGRGRYGTVRVATRTGAVASPSKTSLAAAAAGGADGRFDGAEMLAELDVPAVGTHTGLHVGKQYALKTTLLLPGSGKRGLGGMAGGMGSRLRRKGREDTKRRTALLAAVTEAQRAAERVAWAEIKARRRLEHGLAVSPNALPAGGGDGGSGAAAPPAPALTVNTGREPLAPAQAAASLAPSAVPPHIGSCAAHATRVCPASLSVEGAIMTALCHRNIVQLHAVYVCSLAMSSTFSYIFSLASPLLVFLPTPLLVANQVRRHVPAAPRAGVPRGWLAL